MAKKRDDDILWNMLSTELELPEIREVQEYLEGESDFYEMGYGELFIEPYDARGGLSRMFRVRHAKHGEMTISRSELHSALHDLSHHLRK